MQLILNAKVFKYKYIKVFQISVQILIIFRMYYYNR